MFKRMCHQLITIAFLSSVAGLWQQSEAAQRSCYTARVIEERWEKEDEVKTLRFRFSNHDCGFRPGDAVEIRGKGLVTTHQKRIYSLARLSENAFTERKRGTDLFEITFRVLKHDPSNPLACLSESSSFSLGFFLKGAKVGDRVSLHPWHEDGAPLRLQDADLSAEEPLVLIAGGLGVTPHLSLIRHFDESGILSKRKVVLVYSFSTYSDYLFQKELGELEKRYPKTFKVLAHPTQEPNTRRLTADDLSQFMLTENLSPENSGFFICGSPGFAEASKKIVLSIGGSSDKIRISGQ